MRIKLEPFYRKYEARNHIGFKYQKTENQTKIINDTNQENICHLKI